MLGDHWSYIGIGWQLGIESCALSVLDGLNIADQPPGAKTCINLDARAYEYLAQEYPLLCERLKKALAEDKVELIAGSYSQPMATLYSGESSIRQIVVGHDVIRKALGVEIESFLEEEEFSHPQLPQILNAAGVKYTSLAQVDTWAYAGCPELPLNVFHWKGLDGSTILCQAKNSLFGYFGSEEDLEYFSTPKGEAAIAKLGQLGKPCLQFWDEFGWENPEKPNYESYPAKFAEFSAKHNVEYVTLRGYLKKYGSQAKETVYLNMDSWNKLLPWGIGGDQVRVNARRVEAMLHAAERFDAAAHASAGMKAQINALDSAWRNLLTAQSHDVGLCEYSRWQGDRMAPLGLIEDHHDQTWGSIGYHHLDEGEKDGKATLEASLMAVADRVSKSHAANGPSVVVFNACSWDRTGLTRTGKCYLRNRLAENVSVVNSAGETVPFQVERSENDTGGKLAMVDVTFLAENVPGMGYDTYFLKFTPQAVASPATALTVNEEKFELENPFVRVRLDPEHGGIVSLVEKESGKEFISAEKFCSPAFHGQPNMKYPFLAKDPDAEYDSSRAKATLMWLEKGPLRATLKAVHKWKQLTFETRVTLTPSSPNVEILSRILTSVPPDVDDFPTGRAERNINHGYWLAFAPAFPTTGVRRDFPLGTEKTEHERLHGLTFADLVSEDQGLLIIHPGCQYFRKESDGSWSNLVMREWESHFTHEYGFPNYAEFRHALLAHGADMDDGQRTRAAMEFDSPLLTAVSTAGSGSLPAKKSFVRVGPENVLLSAFRKRPDSGYELRVLETAGKAATAKIELGFAATRAVETDLHGRPTGKPMTGKEISLPLQAWQFRTLQIV